MQVPKTNIEIDGFRRRAELTLITHFHRDHLGGVAASSLNSPIVCSEITGRLLKEFDGVNPERVVCMEHGAERRFSLSTGRVQVTAYNANHCPGALMFGISCNGKRYLHTGDFRLNDALRRVASQFGSVDVLYVDSTYADPRYRFPPQEECIRTVLDLSRDNLDKEIIVGLYTIGKNRIVEAIWREFRLPVYVTQRCYRAYRAIGMADVVTRDRGETPFRGYSRGYLESYFKMQRKYRSDDVVVIVPTGWALDEEQCDPRYHYVPYSEHCDFEELEEFKRLVDPRRVVPV